MNIRKRLLSVTAVFCILLGLLSLAGCEEEKPLEPTEKFYVNDFSDVLSEEAEETILAEGRKLNETEATKGAQVVVVTVKTIGDEDINDYSVELGRRWGIGDKDEDNGVLILLVTEDRNVRIATGYGIEGALPDSKVGRILDHYAVPDFKNDDFESGILKTYKAVVNEVYNEYGITPDDYVPADTLEESQDSPNVKKIVISWIILIVIVVLYLIFFRGHIVFFPIGFGGGGRFGGGGFGGSSGGGSFGGFSGGGGSFGGGGAGRGF